MPDFKESSWGGVCCLSTDILAPNDRGILDKSLKHSAVVFRTDVKFSLNNIEGDRVFLKGSRYLTLKLCLAPSSGILGAFLHADNFSHMGSNSFQGRTDVFFPLRRVELVDVVVRSEHAPPRPPTRGFNRKCISHSNRSQAFYYHIFYFIKKNTI